MPSLYTRHKDMPRVELRSEGSAQGTAQRRPSGVPFLFAPFLWASKEKGPVCAAERALQIIPLPGSGGMDLDWAI
jgi:hypothetical protein